MLTISIEIDWVRNMAYLRDSEGRTGQVSIEGFKFTDEFDLKAQIENMWYRDEINMKEE